MNEREAKARGLAGEVVRRSLIVAVLAIPLIVVCWRASAGRPFGGLSFGIYIGVAALLVLCEQWLPFELHWGSAVKGNRTDLVYVIVASVMDKAMFVACVTLVASVGRTVASAFQVSLWPTTWSLAWQVAGALLIADAATYVRHRLAHASSVLWRFHRIHHSMTGLYWIRSAYTHPLEQLMILTAIMLPISFLGAPDRVVAIVAFLFGLSGLLQHANIDSRSSVLNYVFATPEVHRAHHRADDASLTNFSAFFVLMDVLLGTYARPVRSEKPFRVGLDGEVPFPSDFLSHLTMPFRRDPVARRHPEVAAATLHGEP